MATVRLGNGVVALEVDAADGSIVALHHERSGREVALRADWARALRLRVPLPDRRSGLLCDPAGHAIDSVGQRATITTGPGWLDVRYGDLESDGGTFAIDVGYRVELADGSDELRLTLTIDNRSANRIDEVQFPWVSGLTVVDRAEDDCLVFAPRVVRIADLLPIGQPPGWEEHPFAVYGGWPTVGGPALPWVDVGGPRCGITLSSDERTGALHTIAVQDQTTGSRGEAPCFGLAWSHLTRIEPGASWTSPTMTIALHDGDWHVAADRYRASMASWYVRPARSELADSVVSVNSTWTARDFGQLETIADDAARFGVTDVVMWDFGSYTPDLLADDDHTGSTPRLGAVPDAFGGADRLRTATDRARALGVRTGIILSQRLWNRGALTPELAERAERWAIRTESGAPMVERWSHHHHGVPQWDGHFASDLLVMCPAVAEWQAMALDNLGAVFETAGFDTFFYDQALEGTPCFAAGHGHDGDPSGSIKASVAFVAALRERLRAVRPNAALIAEGIEVRQSQHADLLWSWGPQPRRDGHWARGDVWRYAVPWSPVGLPVDDDLPAANRYFADGIHLAFIPRSLESGKVLGDFPAFASHLASLIALKRDVAPLLDGCRFVDTVGIACDGAYAKGYAAADGLAVVVANVTGDDVDAALRVDRARHRVTTAPSRTRSTRGGDAACTPTTDGLSVALAPFEVAVVAFEPEETP